MDKRVTLRIKWEPTGAFAIFIEIKPKIGFRREMLETFEK